MPASRYFISNEVQIFLGGEVIQDYMTKLSVKTFKLNTAGHIHSLHSTKQTCAT